MSLNALADKQVKTRAVLTKEPKCPKLVKDQKVESFWKEYDTFEKDLISSKPGTEDIAKKQAVRELLLMLKECSNDEVRRYCTSYIIENNECNKSSEKVKEKINLKFGKTHGQDKKECNSLET